MATGSHLGFKGSLTVHENGSNADPLGEEGSNFYADREKERDALVSRLRGKVSVGAVTALPMSGETKSAPPARKADVPSANQ